MTPDGNLTLIDDVGAVASVGKQFVTVESKSGNTFYLVIDRDDKGNENVHFLNLVDEADLMALLGDEQPIVPKCTCTDKCAIGAINAGCEVCRTNMADCTGKEPEPVKEPVIDTPVEPEPEKKSGSPVLIIVLLLAIIGGGAFYWFKLRDPKPDNHGDDDLDDYDFGQDDEDVEETELDDGEDMSEYDDEIKETDEL